MDEDSADVPVQETRRRLIERPRLTRLLDETKARLILLHAPAGYGKTTLARQWLEAGNRPHAWYTATDASRDIASLGVGLARAASPLVPEASRRIEERLLATKDPGREAQVLADILAEDLDPWPLGAWLVLDDYQRIAGSSAADDFVRRLLDVPAISLLIASRVRPSWVSSRVLLYGEVVEIGRSQLAMDLVDATLLFGRTQSHQGLEALLTVTEGWPAVLALAAIRSEEPISLPWVSSELYGFFAQELYSILEDDDRVALRQVAVAGVADRELVVHLIGSERAKRLIEVGARIGFLDEQTRDFEIHPLLRDFLVNVTREDPEELCVLASRATAQLIRHERWDEAFSVIDEFEIVDMIEPLIEAAYPTAVDDGRIASFRRWVDFATSHKRLSPVVQLALADLAFRAGQFAEAESLALSVGDALTDADMRARALLLAGRSAYVGSAEERALGHFRRARREALDQAHLREAARGEVVCASDLELALDDEVLALLEDDHNLAPSERVRSASSLIQLRSNRGLPRDESLAARAEQLLSLVRDPLTRTAFLYVRATSLSLQARYDESLDFGKRLLHEAERYRLDFVQAYAFQSVGVAQSGLRDYESSARSFDEAALRAKSSADPFAMANVAASRGRMDIARGEFEQAIADTSELKLRSVQGPMAGEVLGVRSVALACLKRFEEAEREAERALAASRSVDVVAHVLCSKAIVAFRRGAIEAANVMREALELTVRAELQDRFIHAYRADPELVLAALADPETRSLAMQVVEAAGDLEVLTRAGADVARPTSPIQLTPRESEVLALVAEGKSNQQIAGQLFISVPTVKVHLRHIYEKLGVRNRTAAVVAGLSRGYATSATDSSSTSDDTS